MLRPLQFYHGASDNLVFKSALVTSFSDDLASVIERMHQDLGSIAVDVDATEVVFLGEVPRRVVHSRTLIVKDKWVILSLRIMHKVRRGLHRRMETANRTQMM